MPVSARIAANTFVVCWQSQPHAYEEGKALVAIHRRGGIIPVTFRLFAAPLSSVNYLQRQITLTERLLN